MHTTSRIQYHCLQNSKTPLAYIPRAFELHTMSSANMLRIFGPDVMYLHAKVTQNGP